jgi:hypothetical protein
MTQYIKRLPAVFQTVTEKKFFDATFDQVFSKKDSDLLSGFIGRRNPGQYNPISDFYLPEPSKNRTWWQLEPTAYARNTDTTKSNVFFYEDLLENIEYYGGNTLNQDRLFESEYYSFGPPIDYDMFLNYQNYYWIEQGLPVIDISGVLASEIIGQQSFTTGPLDTPPNFTLSTGMTISLLDDPEYVDPHTVENFGGCIGIGLVEKTSDLTAGTIFEFLPWDGTIILSTGRVIRNEFWDINPWEVQPQPGNGDYITIERGALDKNAWSRTNKWFHIDTINRTIAVTASVFPPTASRALRPIIQFAANIPLYRSGTQFRETISFGFRNDITVQPLTLAQFQGQPLSTINTTYNIEMADLDLVCWFDDPLSNGYIYRANVDGLGIVTFTQWTSPATPVLEGDIVFIAQDAPYDGAQQGQTWYFSAGEWLEVYNEKVRVNQPPLFILYDHNGVELDDVATYPDSSFRGSEIFSYKVNSNPGATVDPVLKFPIVYTSLGQASDILFQNNLITDRYTYNGTLLTPITGYYYYKFFYNAEDIDNPIYYNNWNLYDICDCTDIIPTPPVNCIEVSKQRVIDKFVVGFGSEFQFKLSVTPYGYVAGGPAVQPEADLVISVNGVEVKQFDALTNPAGYTFVEINNRVYVDLITFLSNLLTTTQAQPPVVEAQTYTHGLLDPANPGYFEIPQQLEANPTQLEIGEISGSDLSEQFGSIIANQVGFTGSAFGGINNYRDSRKNRSVGSFILQNLAPALKSMLVSSSKDLSFIDSIRYSADEYTKFKNKFLTVAQQLINQGFSAAQVQSNTVQISAWVGEILRILNVSREFSKSFAYSFMAAEGIPTFKENFVVPSSGIITLTNYVDLSDPKNSIYFYDITNATLDVILIDGVDYNYIATTDPISVQFSTRLLPYNSVPGATSAGNVITVTSTTGLIEGMAISVVAGTGVFPANTRVLRVLSPTTFTTTNAPTVSLSGGLTVVRGSRRLNASLYRNPIPTYIPSTPTKVGAWGAYVPRVELDTTYAIPTDVIIGHDGSKSIAYGDYRDDLLLDLESRIYNSLQQKFRNEYYIPLRVESVRSGFFRQTRYSVDEYLEITESYLNKWAAKNRANYRVNDWPTASLTTPVNELWKLYNYRAAATPFVSATPLPGNWKGIFQHYYDTYYPDTRPWEMLGFSSQPDWWQFEYGAPVLNIAGQEVWTSLAAGNNIMWADLEFGIIRQGPTALYDSETSLALPQEMWARPGLSSIVPVDIFGELIPIITLFYLPYSGNPYAPFDHFDDPWIYGDGAPVEQAWMSTSGYAYSCQEFMYLMRPGPFGELLWDTLGTELSPGMITVPSSVSPVRSSKNWQYVQNDIFSHDTDPFFEWMRPKNRDQIVHAEIVDGEVQVRFGYQTWISDRILFLGKNIADTFGQKIRTLDVNLANKLAGFINKDTTNTYITSVTPGSNTNTLIIPSTNFDVFLHKSPVVDTYSYSGIIIRALADGTFVVYGYDLLNAEFTTLDRADNTLIDVTVGGTPAEFRQFESGATYNQGEIVRYNGVYYESLTIQLAEKFTPANWQKLKTLPVIGGVSVTYKPVSLETITRYPYGSILKNAQEVFDLMIGWGAYLESRGWQFKEVSQDTNQISDWLSSAKQFLFWLNTNWAPDASIQLSPLANTANLLVGRGYPNDVESLSNGVYSILDKFGVAIPPNGTTTDRDGRFISVSPTNLSTGGIYYLQVNASETEHVLIFDNVTSFADIIYAPLLRARQERLSFYGFRSNNWYGKMEAPGYLIIDDQLVPNYDTIVNSMRYFYDPNVTIDNPSLEDLGRHLIGYESKSYLDNLNVANDVQYLFYQGAIRQKGTKQSIEKLFRSTKVQADEIIKIFEEWALKLGDFGNTVEQVSTEFKLTPEQNTGEVIVARLNFVPSKIGFVRQVNVLNAQNTYINIPKVVFPLPDATPDVAWTDFSNVETYFVGSVAKYDDSLGNPVYYSSKYIQLVVLAATTVNGNLLTDFVTGSVIDGVVLALGDRILIKNQTNPAENGLYFVRNAGAPGRSTYGNTGSKLVGLTTFIQNGTINSGTTWVQTTPAPITIGVSNIVCTQSSVAFIPTNWTVVLATRITRAYIVLDNTNRISRVDITDPGFGYLSAPLVTIDSGAEPHNLDKLYSVWQGEILSDPSLDNIINIDIDEVDKWTVRPTDPTVALVFPTTNKIDYALPNAGYVNFNDVTLSSFDTNQTALRWGTKDFNPVQNNTVWVAKTFTEDWDVYKLIDITSASGFDVIENAAGELFLRTLPGYLITPQFAGGANETNFGNMLALQVIEARATPTINYTPAIVATATAFVPYTADLSATVLAGSINTMSIVTPGRGYVTAPVITIAGPTDNAGVPVPGITASAIAVINTSGQVTNIIITDPGTNYSLIYPVSIFVESPDNAGTVISISIVNQGSNYSVAPVVTILGDGVGANATATVEDGKVTQITINPTGGGGNGYTFATISIAPPPPPIPGPIASIEVTKAGAGYIAAPIVTILGDGVGATAKANIAGGQVSSIDLLTPGAGYTTATATIAPPLSVSPDTNYAVAFAFNSVETAADPTHNYYNLLTLEGNPIEATDIPDFVNFTKLMLFKTMRFLDEPLVGTPSYVAVGDKIWVDGANLPIPQWNVFTVITPTIQYPTGHQPYRTQEPLINTSLFENASVFNSTGTELVQLPVYDPFKFILPGPAKQNITYISLLDPANYNVTGDERLFSENITFGAAQVGQLWWDISDTRYVYYEQPIALDGSETSVDNLVYRRDYWAQLFPGSTVAIYEWVKSPVPPAEYTGTGVPRDLTSYVQISTSNRFTNITEINYYFWVLGATDKPNVENRTFAAVDVARLLQNPKNQGFAFFSPIQQTSTNNSYMFYNVQEILAYQGDNIQVQYRISERDDQEHAQWALFREGDTSSLVTNQYWNKMVDSICGYTKVLPVTGEYSGGIIIANFLPWDIFGWDVAPYDDATPLTSPEYGEVLPVPDPTLSEGEKYGITYRPRQGMFIKLQAARKVFVESANELLSHIPIRDTNPSWNVGVATDEYWTYTNWYELGYENVLPTIVYQTLTQANTALIAGQLPKGTILRVNDGTIDNRYILYAVVQVNPNVPTLSLNEVAIENSAIKLLDTVYTAINKYGLSVELRQLLNAFRTEVMVNNNIVDQNELYFSMLNYVVSEQKNPDWVFKTSYIVIKEDNIPLTQSPFYIPDQIDNIISYIRDVKPYHTQIRDYSTVYTTTDIAPGTASDFFNWVVKLQFGPTGTESIDPYAGSPIFDPMLGWDANQGPYNLPWDFLAQFGPGVTSSGSVVTVSSTAGLYPYMAVEVIGGIGAFAPNTFIVSINSSTTFTVSVPPTTPLSGGATINVRLPWDSTNMALIINQFISRNAVTPAFNPGVSSWPGFDENAIQVPLTFFDASKIGFSQLFPYTFNFDALNLDNPQTFITPYNIVAVKIGDETLYYGQDYYVEYNTADLDYTIYFFNDPGISPVPVAFVWLDGGAIQNSYINGYRNELAFGTPNTGQLITVDTLLPISNNTSVLAPYATSWAGADATVQQLIINAGGTLNIPPVISPVPLNNILTITHISNVATVTTTAAHGITLLANFSAIITGVTPATYNGTYDITITGPNTFTFVMPEVPLTDAATVGTYYLLLSNSISFRQSKDFDNTDSYMRNADVWAGTLVFDLPAPTESTYNIDVITVFVDPVTHPSGTNILPDPLPGAPGVIWIDGERIEYRYKAPTVADTWELKLVRRGTEGTAPTEHLALVPDISGGTNLAGETVTDNPPLFSPNKVWVIDNNAMPGSPDTTVWNASNPLPDLLTPLGWNAFLWDDFNWDIVDCYGSILGVPLGGLWYATTVQANFLKDEEGKSIP